MHHVRDAKILRESIQEFPGPVAVYDADDILIACNELYRWVHGDAFERVATAAGHRRIRYADLIRESAAGVVPAEEIDAHIADRIRAQRLADGTPVDRYYPNRGWFRIVKIRTPSGAVAGFATDITELKETTVALEQARAAAEAANIAKSTFLANMSHELRTPLNAIIGLAEALESGIFGVIENPQHGEYIGDIRRSGHHLLALISDLLDLAKVEAGAMEIERAIFSLAPLIEECAAMVRSAAEDDDIRLSIATPPTDLRLSGDARKIKQVLINLLSNAVKYSMTGGEVRVAAALTSEGVRISFEDDGVGIPESDLDRIFEPFGRLHQGLTAAREGTGLGLPIAKRFTELHGGTIGVTSAPGQGTRVTVHLPPDMAR